MPKHLPAIAKAIAFAGGENWKICLNKRHENRSQKDLKSQNPERFCVDKGLEAI